MVQISSKTAPLEVIKHNWKLTQDPRIAIWFSQTMESQKHIVDKTPETQRSHLPGSSNTSTHHHSLNINPCSPLTFIPPQDALWRFYEVFMKYIFIYQITLPEYTARSIVSSSVCFLSSKLLIHVTGSMPQKFTTQLSSRKVLHKHWELSGKQAKKHLLVLPWIKATME